METRKNDFFFDISLVVAVQCYGLR